MLKHPGGWETALAVEHVLKKWPLLRRAHFMINFAIEFAGQNLVMFK